MRARLVLSGLSLALMIAAAPAGAAVVAKITVDGAIGPATADYIERALRVAAGEDAVCLLIALDTPGGLLDSTQQIVQTLYAAGVPVVVYVTPAGAGATSAGCFITLAADVAAMTPGTTIGAAHPVAAGGQEIGDTMREKLENYAATFVESIARRRDRNVAWAREAVIKSASLTAEQALEQNVVEIVAADEADLLAQLDGREVRGRPLATADAEVREIAMLPRERVFQLLWRPEVMFILMLVAVYGIIGEISNPGAILPGVIGVIALILALYLGAVLPVNVAGVALIVLALILFILEALTPSFGLLVAGGAVAFFLGGLMLFDTPAPQFRLSWKLLLPATIITVVFFTVVVASGLRAQRLPDRVGIRTLPGRTAEALTDIDAQSGWVRIEGESWRAVSTTPITRGQSVEITAVHGLTLEVKPKSTPPTS